VQQARKTALAVRDGGDVEDGYGSGKV